MADPSSFTLRELTGPKNELVLQGRALPYRPVSFEGSMRAEFTWYPGNPVATVQMLGSKEEPSTINGMWKDRFIKSTTDAIPLLGIPPLPIIAPQGKALLNGQLLGDVMAVVRTVDAFRRRGQLLEVHWDEITRHGILTKFRHNWLRREDVEWEMEFTWISQGDPLTQVAFGATISLPSIVDKILSILDKLQTSVEALFALVSSIKRAISDSLDTIVNAVAAIKDIADKMAKAILSPFDAAKATVAAFQTIRDEAWQIFGIVKSVPSAAIINVQDITSIDYSESLVAASYQRQVAKNAKELQAEAARQADDLLAKTSSQEILATVIARDGEDLRDVSWLFYDTADHWRELASFNGIKGSRLSAGQVVLVPKLAGAA